MIAYKKLYHCKIQDSEDPSIYVYGAPIKKYLNYQPLSGYVDTLQYGDSVNKRWRLIVPLKGNENEYHKDDLLYLDGVEPDTESEDYVNGDGANARITVCKPQWRALVIEIEKIIER